MLAELELVEIYKSLIGNLNISFGGTGYSAVCNVGRLIYYMLMLFVI